jgi:broad specificity phosphatase PhoE
VIYAARHGETTWNATGRYQGRLESQLSALGVRQAQALAAHFDALRTAGAEVPARVIASPLLRCAFTAAFAGEALRLPLELDARVIEIDHGSWNGRMRDDIIREDPRTWETWQKHPASIAFSGGKSLRAVDARVRAFLAEIAALPGDSLVVTHDTGVRLAVLAAAGRPLADFWDIHVENGAFALIDASEAGLSLKAECVTDHLAGDRADISRQAL